MRYIQRGFGTSASLIAAFCTLLGGVFSPNEASAASCARTLTADVVALDQSFFYNRLGAVNPAGMIYALRRDVVSTGLDPSSLSPGYVALREDKRARPLVLRMNVGDCLKITFQNLLASSPVNDEQPATRSASVHVIGLQLVGSIASDGSNVGTNTSSLVAPGGSATYTYYAEREGTNLLYSGAAMTGGEGDGGSLAMGLFGAVNVEPKGARYYRSQVTRDDMDLATVGTASSGHPIIDYDKEYPLAHPRTGAPILNMLDGNEIVHSDLNAIIRGPFTDAYPINPVYPDRGQSFREFTVVFHDEITAVQAFPAFFDDELWEHTLHSVRDAFAINYGTGGIGSEIIANRLGVGPVFDCTGCKYEEFFLTSWALGDPAMVVDVPANATDESGNLILGPKATKAFYADDPSNVHHSYIKDHVKFRMLHAGPKEHHIFHLHAHQWLFTPDDDNSAYLDSQAIGPGSAYTLEIAYNGTGNRNQTVGDSIFHCHFYPHFAMGMWELWRSHDVFENGTALNADGRPAPGSRAYPDAEILTGTPIPGLVPIPGLAMAPMPGHVEIENGQVVIGPGQPIIEASETDMANIGGNPGYPFFVAGVAGHRPPHPPLDTIDDGGLPRHVLVGGTNLTTTTPLDFTRELIVAQAIEVPEEGTAAEKLAMAFHEVRSHPSSAQDGNGGAVPADFTTNGLLRQPGAPFADPCIDDAGGAVGTPRIYKTANIQTDIVFNKVGWHFPQSRITTLWGDVAATLAGTRPPEPFFFRANTDDCITFLSTNLVPNIYEMDDYQVRTPTDVMGQHIHLVKFDVTSSDGSGNGWNYEDGTFSPDEVLERIHAINAEGGSWSGDMLPAPVSHPFFGVAGAQTTVQRWYVDDVLNNTGDDRTLRTVFTHDHFGPSTHQQAGLYASLVIEPKGSTWRDSETGAIFGTRGDGGPTSWRADILTADQNDSYREFMFQFADFQLAYEAGGGFPDPGRVINPPAKIEVGLPFLLERPEICPNGTPAPCPEAISADDVGTFSVNYRNEPVALRVRDPETNTQATGLAGDLSHVYRSDIERADPALNIQPDFYPPLTSGVEPGDPFTPLMRVYENDKVQMRIQVGATEEGHNITVQGIKWLQEPSSPTSGWRNSQMIGISEHFEFVMPAMVAVKGGRPSADYLYQMGASVDDQWNGNWGLLRSYNAGPSGLRDDLLPLPNNPQGKAPNKKGSPVKGVCPADIKGKDPRNKNFKVVAVLARDILPEGTLVYNSREVNGGPLHDPTAILYLNKDDIKFYKKGPKAGTYELKDGVPVEPLILRANAGDCINVTLINLLPEVMPDLDGYSTLPMIVDDFNANQVRPSNHVGLRPQLVAYDMLKHGGANIGFNAEPDDTLVQNLTVGPCDLSAVNNDVAQCEQIKLQWYAGDISIEADGDRVFTPVEFGATNLISSDPIKHASKGAIGALIIEPEGSTWESDYDSGLNSKNRASATVTLQDDSTFREFVVLFQDDLNLRQGSSDGGDGKAVPNTADAEDPEDSGQKAINYRTEPIWFRKGYAADTSLESTRGMQLGDVLSNDQVGGDPETPVFTASVGTPVRFRLLQPGGHPRNHVFQVHGHNWQREPYISGSVASQVIGSNPLSQVIGAQEGHGPSNHFDIVIDKAGGEFGVAGDYLIRDQASFGLDGGLWGILRVTP